MVTESGLKKEYWGFRYLAYPINKNKKGHYTMLCLKCNDDVIKELERNFRINENIIKYLSVRVQKFDDGASLMMQSPVEDSASNW